jgi:hypothetical protein
MSCLLDSLFTRTFPFTYLGFGFGLCGGDVAAATNMEKSG